MKNFFLRSWKTTLLGLTTIILTLLQSHGKVDTATAAGITAGIGLLVAKDHNITGAGNE